MPVRVQTPEGIHEFPDGTTPEEIDAILGAEPAAPAAPERTWTDTAVDALPMVGGSVGGLLGAVAGPLGMVGGAALGGAGGEGWRQNINRLRGKAAPSSMGEAAGDIATAGAVQGATEASGGLIGKGLQRGGRAIYRGLLKPSKALRDDFGANAIVDTLIKEGATISRKGSEKMTRALSGSREQALRLVQDAAGADDLAPVTARDVSRGLGEARTKLRLRKAIGQPDRTGAVRDRIEALADSLHGSPVPPPRPTPRGPTSFSTMSIPESAVPPRAPVAQRPRPGIDVVRAQQMKEEAQDAASGAYRMVARGQKSQIGAKGLLDEGTARGFRRAIEARVPAVKGQNARTQALLGGMRALDDALEARANTLAVGGARDLIAAGVGGSVAGPAGVSAGLLTRLLSSPRVGSAAAIGLDRTGRNVPMDDLIRALQLAMQEEQ